MVHKKLSKKTVVTKTASVAFSTFISKSLGLIREMLQVRYFGVGPLADAFFASYKMPNSLRKIFAEGALSAAFVPTLVETYKKYGVEEANKLTSLIFMVSQTVLMAFCFGVFLYTDQVICFLVPGWSLLLDTSLIKHSVEFLRILIFFVVFISASSVLAGALQAVHRFAIPAYSQTVMNILTVAELLIVQQYNLSVATFCWMILFNGAVYFLMHVWAFSRCDFTAALPTKITWKLAYTVFAKFIPCMISLGAVEVNLFIDQTFASYLPVGSIGLLKYSSDFMRIPLGVFAVSFATILLPYLSRISVTHPKRLQYYLLESAKCIAWVTVPAMLMMIFFAHEIFYTTLHFVDSHKFTCEHVIISQYLFKIFVTGLFFFSLNKIILSVYYALHKTLLPTIVVVGCTVLNTVLNYLLIESFGAAGLAASTIIAMVVQVVGLLYVLDLVAHIQFPVKRFLVFLVRYSVQLACIGVLFVLCYYLTTAFCLKFISPVLIHLFSTTFLFWFLVGPYCLVTMLIVYLSRKWFSVKLYFLN